MNELSGTLIAGLQARIVVLETALRTIAEKSAHAAKFAREAGEIMFSDHALGARQCALEALGTATPAPDESTKS